MSALGLVAIILVMLVGVASVGLRRRGYLGGVVAIQCAYFGLAYVVRPVILLAVQPAPRLGDSMADPRMASLGYEVALTAVLKVVVCGIAAFSAISILLMRLSKERTEAFAMKVGRRAPVSLRAAWCILGAGWMFRLSTIAVQSTITDTLAAVGSVGAGAVLMFQLYGRGIRQQLLIISAVATSEFVWSLMSASKAPIFACGLWLLVAGIRSGVRSKATAVAAVAVALGLIVVFPLVQQSKIAAGTFTNVQGSTDVYPSALQGAIPIVRRFDLIAAAMDAVTAGQGSWISGVDAARRAFLNLIPTQLQSDKAQNTGATWAIEVRGQTVAYSDTGVHLADGPIAEGYVIGGYMGVSVEVVLLGLATAGVSRLLASRSRFAILLGISMLTQPFLFERGVLGMSEALGKNLQVVLIAGAIGWFVDMLVFSRGRGCEHPNPSAKQGVSRPRVGTRS